VALLGALSGVARADGEFDNLFNLSDPLDVDNNGLVTPRDALLIINLLEHSFPVTPSAVMQSEMAASPAANPLVQPVTYYYDTSHDGIISPVDALLVINHLVMVPEPSGGILAGLGMVIVAAYAGWRKRSRK
jgi:hypothetical protein